MCTQGRPDETPWGVRIFAGDVSDAYLQRAGIQRGYAISIWRGRHVAEPTELSDTEAGQYWDDVLRVARAVQLHYTPAKLNLMMLGNSLPHLHTHIVPRYLDDRDPGHPPRFMDPGQATPPLPVDAVRRDAAKLRQLVEGQVAE